MIPRDDALLEILEQERVAERNVNVSDAEGMRRRQAVGVRLAAAFDVYSPFEVISSHGIESAVYSAIMNALSCGASSDSTQCGKEQISLCYCPHDGSIILGYAAPDSKACRTREAVIGAHACIGRSLA